MMILLETVVVEDGGEGITRKEKIEALRWYVSFLSLPSDTPQDERRTQDGGLVLVRRSGGHRPD